METKEEFWIGSNPPMKDQPCVICGKIYEGYGNNAAPLKDGRCCKACNRSKVLPYRIKTRFRMSAAKGPWEHNRPTTYVGGDALEPKFAQMMDDAFMVASNNTPLNRRERAAVKELSDALEPLDPKMRTDVLKKSISILDASSIKQSKRMQSFLDIVDEPFPRVVPADTADEEKMLIHVYHTLLDPPPLVYAGSSVYGHFLRSLEDSTFWIPANDTMRDQYTRRLPGIIDELRAVTPFVINHNWAAVLGKAGENDGGDDCVLPNDACTVFELAFKGMRVICLATDLDDYDGENIDDIGLHIWARFHVPMNAAFDKRWIGLGAERLRQSICPPGNDAFYKLLRAQLRAACVMLESQVAETEIVRANYKRNEKRERQGKAKFFDYRVINLARRHRYAPPVDPANNEKRASPRLHFVKGHWRHYDNYRVRIKCFYRGDADLGWIDKEYRL